MRVLVPAVLAVLLGSVLCGCSGNSGASSPITPAPVPSPGPLPAPPPPATPGPLFGIGFRILPGQTVLGTVEPTDPACYPNWDSSATCKTYLVTAPVTGRLKVTLKWTPPPDIDAMDLFLVSPNGSYEVSPDSGSAKRTAEMPVAAGFVYSILAMSYLKSPLPFELVTTIE